MPFPANIPIDVGSSGGIDLGVTSVRMEDNSIHNQTHYDATSQWLDLNVSHSEITLAEYDTVEAYLRANADLEFDLLDPARGRTYTGRMIAGTLREELSSGERWTISWQFAGKRSL